MVDVSNLMFSSLFEDDEWKGVSRGEGMSVRAFLDLRRCSTEFNVYLRYIST